ncbi:hypothetical protein [Microseira sp. BLCC-F43]|jgi:hypothetical protein|uniref:hypothetical protein n=1 Tax=Microseira sp. BLCC-F43 TaxID=3153602 RepID=UPI0035B71AF8
MRKYIIFQADEREEHEAERRILAHTGACTDILAEYFDSSDAPIPEPGYRPSEYCQVQEAIDPESPGSSTHFRRGDWEVVRVEQYAPIGTAEFDLVVVCYCRYAPIESPLFPIRRGKGSPQLQEASGMVT